MAKRNSAYLDQVNRVKFVHTNTQLHTCQNKDEKLQTTDD